MSLNMLLLLISCLAEIPFIITKAIDSEWSKFFFRFKISITVGIFVLFLTSPTVMPIVGFGILLAVSIFIAVFLSTRQKSRNDRYELIFIIFDLLLIVTYYAFINILLYKIDPAMFRIDELLNLTGISNMLWHFWFYSFTVAITYSNGMIEAVNLWSQIFQFSQVIIFYFVLAKDIQKLQEGYTQKSDTSSAKPIPYTIYSFRTSFSCQLGSEKISIFENEKFIVLVSSEDTATIQLLRDQSCDVYTLQKCVLNLVTTYPIQNNNSSNT